MSAWAALALQAYRLNLVSAARPAVVVLHRHFVRSTPTCAVWQAHPMDCMQLEDERAVAAAPGLLRAFAMVCYVHAEHCLGTLDRKTTSTDRSIGVRSHVEQLKMVKMLLIGIRVLPALLSLAASEQDSSMQS
jgi:hypothetical protein